MRSALKSLICATSRCCQLSDYSTSTSVINAVLFQSAEYSTSTSVINAVLFPDNLSDS